MPGFFDLNVQCCMLGKCKTRRLAVKSNKGSILCKQSSSRTSRSIKSTLQGWQMAMCVNDYAVWTVDWCMNWDIVSGCRVTDVSPTDARDWLLQGAERVRCRLHAQRWPAPGPAAAGDQLGLLQHAAAAAAARPAPVSGRPPPPGFRYTRRRRHYASSGRPTWHV